MDPQAGYNNSVSDARTAALAVRRSIAACDVPVQTDLSDLEVQHAKDPANEHAGSPTLRREWLSGRRYSLPWGSMHTNGPWRCRV
jgi:hypothetical protein